MRDTMREQGQGALDASVKRLERALGALETRFDRRLKRMEALEAARGGEGRSDRAQLIAELDAARARERALESIAAEASAALGRAAEEVRAALAESSAEDDGPPETSAFTPEADTTSYVETPMSQAEDGGDVFLPQAAKG